MRTRLARFVAWSKPFRTEFGNARGALVALKYYALRSGVFFKVGRLPMPGTPHGVLLRAGTSDTKVYSQHVLRRELDFPTNFAPRVILDGGANIGIASIGFATRWPTATIVAVELESANFKLLEQNAKPYKNIIPIKAALWSHVCSVAVANAQDQPWSFKAQESTSDSAIDGVSIDELFMRMSLPAPDFVKLDVEGAEREIFSAVSRDWLDAVRLLAVEPHDFIIPGIRSTLTQMLLDRGFSLHQRGEYIIATVDVQ